MEGSRWPLLFALKLFEILTVLLLDLVLERHVWVCYILTALTEIVAIVSLACAITTEPFLVKALV